MTACVPTPPLQVSCSVNSTYCASEVINRAEAPSANNPPLISLLTDTYLSAWVNIARGGSYAVCGQGVSPTQARPCELGASATDPDAGADLSYKVMVCPPSECVVGACTVQVGTPLSTGRNPLSAGRNPPECW